MIGKITYPQNFGSLSRYLMFGKLREQEKGLADYLTRNPDRVETVFYRNVSSNTVKKVAQEMRMLQQAAKMQSRSGRKLENPVVHLSVSFHKDDDVNPEKMSVIMCKTLDRIGLGDHQTMMVVHKDKEHPHIHAMVNRINPDSWKAWNRSNDYGRLHEIMRELEKEYKLTKVKMPREAGRSSVSISEQKRKKREEPAMTQLGFNSSETSKTVLEKAQKLHHDLSSATSFASFDQALAKKGLYIDRKGAGSVITDGIHQVKSSRVSRDFGIRKLEKKFGEDFGDYLKQRDSMTKDLSPVVDQVDIDAFMKQTNREQQLEGLLSQRKELERKIKELKSYQDRDLELERYFERNIGRAFTNKHEVLENMRVGVSKHGIDTTIRRFRNQPGEFGQFNPNASPQQLQAHLSDIYYNWLEIKGLRERSHRFAALTPDELQNLKSKLSKELIGVNSHIDPFRDDHPSTSLRIAKKGIEKALQQTMSEKGSNDLQARSHIHRTVIEAASIGKSLTQLSVNPGMASVGIAKKIVKRALSQAFEQAKSREMGL